MDASNRKNGEVDDKAFVRNFGKRSVTGKNNLVTRYRDYFTGKFQGKFRKSDRLDQNSLPKENTKSKSEPVSTSQLQYQPQITTEIMSAESSSTQPVWTSDTSKTKPTIISDIESATHSIQAIFRDLKSITPEDANTLLQLFSSEIKGVQNDNTLLLEKTVQLLSSQPETSGIGKSLTASFVNTLWDALPHPPMRSLDKKYMYRDADGGNNNIRMPDLGRAGTAYAKNVNAVRMKKKDLPDPGELFDSLMRRGGIDGEEPFKGSPTGISSQLFYLATIIIHDLFLTDHEDMTKSKTSSYLDLSPLYGCNQEEQNAIRTFEDGKLKPDCFSSKRILGFPPGVGVFLIMFNRFHNYVVEMLAQINDNGRFTKPKPEAEKSAFDKYDNDLFQTGRLVTCGLYVNIVLKDYVRTILNLNRTTSKWDLDPRVEEAKNLLSNPAAEGVGNQVSAEFNLIYRWHSAISQKDEEWTNAEYTRLFPNKSPADVTLPELLRGLYTMEAELPTDPSQRSFANLTRLPDGSYDEGSLASIFQSSVEDLSGAFGAANVPPIMRSIEILSIIQSRSWNMCTLNEFRSFVGLTPHKSFADINPDPIIAKRLKEFYGSPEDLELYPRVVVRKTKPPVVPGSGLCTGYNEVQFDTNIDDGAVLYKLVLRAFPNYFEGNSIYAHFPFTTPEVNREIQKSLGREGLYSWEVPKKKAELSSVQTWDECKGILEDSVNWKVTWGPPISVLTSQESSDSSKTDSSPAVLPFCLAGDAPVNATSRSLIISSFYNLPTGHDHKNDKEHPDWSSALNQFYTDNTADLFEKHKVLIPTVSTSASTNETSTISKTYRVDIVSDICNRVFTRFAAGVFDIPLKLGMGNTVDVNITTDPEEGYTEEELYDSLSVAFICIFNNLDVTKSFAVDQQARAIAKKLGDILMERTKDGKIGEAFDGLKDKLHSLVFDDKTERHVEGWVQKEKERLALKGYGREMVERFIEGGKKSSNFSSNDGKSISASFSSYRLLPYFLEATRIHGNVALLRLYSPSQTTSQTPTSTSPSKSTTYTPGTVYLLNLPLAQHDPTAFPDPETVKLDRNLNSYLTFGQGRHECLGKNAALMGMLRVFRIIIGLKGLRLDVGKNGMVSGGMKSVGQGLELGTSTLLFPNISLTLTLTLTPSYLLSKSAKKRLDEKKKKKKKGFEESMK
ncbi:hypothetical protein SS1G_01657 [Sclerotinia sclerotiorum 1980 UF-70]|uniref:linoleate 8R-lipoxygenase n=1 Tax=Sclerotinia sclerotiorum (strain ATCC 18683 / 1980 / Ss-1) TaxID=665079 RepID=A7E8M9_SCLS1|nr:hypothetical protein SS1G_01657 [Sclerotinia sclerotiorum 1980 UF-70]EDN96731.1 hypothetical protein SS1G_01657 [Sclerotinia sclerotiorum 1980 UF-70]